VRFDEEQPKSYPGFVEIWYHDISIDESSRRGNCTRSEWSIPSLSSSKLQDSIFIFQIDLMKPLDMTEFQNCTKSMSWSSPVGITKILEYHKWNRYLFRFPQYQIDEIHSSYSVKVKSFVRLRGFESISWPQLNTQTQITSQLYIVWKQTNWICRRVSINIWPLLWICPIAFGKPSELQSIPIQL
jgi:hypothetical protein